MGMTTAWAMGRPSQKLLKWTAALKSCEPEKTHQNVLREVTEAKINRLVSGHP